MCFILHILNKSLYFEKNFVASNLHGSGAQFKCNKYFGFLPAQRRLVND